MHHPFVVEGQHCACDLRGQAEYGLWAEFLLFVHLVAKAAFAQVHDYVEFASVWHQNVPIILNDVVGGQQFQFGHLADLIHQRVNLYPFYSSQLAHTKFLPRFDDLSE